MSAPAKGSSEVVAGEQQLFWVAENVIANDFPQVSSALREPDGLLAIGGTLSQKRLLCAYRRGIFPWYSAGQPILWWSPDPRAVLQPGGLKISRSLAKTLRRKPFAITFNRAFAQVIAACGLARRRGTDTWLTREMCAAYTRLHHAGHALSVETWMQGRLVGGLYGVLIGRIFFGESMFSQVSDASKVALCHLVKVLEQRDFRLIDCQLHSRHLESLGATLMPRQRFVSLLERYCTPDLAHHWPQVSDWP